MNSGHFGPPKGTDTVAGDARFRCGTLLYTRAGLFALFTWLLWGDFCFSLMEAIWPSILPLMLKAESASNVVMALVITTIPSAMNFVLNPIISTLSDRYRSRWGRRIPFLIFATPFISIFLILLGFSKSLGGWIYGFMSGVFPDVSVGAVTITLICVLVVSFRFFELFVNTVFWYLFNDVVPVAFMGRFLGLFRVIGSLAGALYSFFLFKYAESHTSMIFFGVAVLYGTVFMLMCLNVKEGEYPPPDTMRKEDGSWLLYVTTFFRESFSHRIFWLVFGYTTMLAAATSIGTFSIFMAFSIGLTLDDVGKISGVAAFIGMLLMYPMGSLVDRLHPIRVMFAAQVGYCLVISVQLIFLFYNFPKDIAFWIYAGAAALAIPIGVANASASLPMVMRIFPHERFGQFCAANAMCGAFGTMVGGVLSGTFLDLMKSLFVQENYYYRFVPVWVLFFMAMSAVMTYLVFREWKKLGGDKSYRPPIEDKFAEFHHSN